MMPASLVRPRLRGRSSRRCPAGRPDGYICVDDLNRFRADEVEAVVQEGIGEITALEQSVVERLARHETLAINVDDELDQARTFGQRLADRVAEFGGSWRFLMLFAAYMVAWMGLNTWLLWPPGLSTPIRTSCSIWSCPASRRCRRR